MEMRSAEARRKEVWGGCAFPSVMVPGYCPGIFFEILHVNMQAYILVFFSLAKFQEDGKQKDCRPSIFIEGSLSPPVVDAFGCSSVETSIVADVGGALKTCYSEAAH